MVPPIPCGGEVFIASNRPVPLVWPARRGDEVEGAWLSGIVGGLLFTYWGSRRIRAQRLRYNLAHPRWRLHCLICGYKWSWEPGDPWPEATVDPDLIAKGNARLEQEEEEAARQRAADWDPPYIAPRDDDRR